jgi:transposase
LRSVRRSAVKAKDQAGNQLRALLVTVLEGLQARFRGLSTKRIAAAAARFKPGEQPIDAEAATRTAAKITACTYGFLISRSLGGGVAGMNPTT